MDASELNCNGPHWEMRHIRSNQVGRKVWVRLSQCQARALLGPRGVRKLSQDQCGALCCAHMCKLHLHGSD